MDDEVTRDRNDNLFCINDRFYLSAIAIVFNVDFGFRETVLGKHAGHQEKGLGQSLVPWDGLFAAGVPPQDARDQGAQKLQLVDGREPHGQAGRRAGGDGRVNGLGKTLFVSPILKIEELVMDVS